MIRYLGQPYEGSDDEMNDIKSAEQRAADGIRCDNCSCWIEGYCDELEKETNDDGWCRKFDEKI